MAEIWCFLDATVRLAPHPFTPVQQGGSLQIMDALESLIPHPPQKEVNDVMGNNGPGIRSDVMDAHIHNRTSRLYLANPFDIHD